LKVEVSILLCGDHGIGAWLLKKMHQ